MDCKSARRELTAFLQGELAPEAAASLRRHLESCADCRGRAELLRGVLRLAEAPEPEPGFAAAVRKRVPREERPSLAPRRLALAFSALLLILGGLASLRLARSPRRARLPQGCLAADCRAS